MKLTDLGKVIAYKWRVQSFSKFKPSATCVAYIDARAVMDLLDDVVGAANWQDEYSVIHNNLYARIGIFVDDRWVWKGDCGTESQMEKEKGESSDSFKRAAVKWSIGRFLYALEVRRVQANEKKSDNNHPFVIDTNGKRVWNLTEYINGLNGKNAIQGQKQPKTVSFNPDAKFPKKEKKGENEPSEGLKIAGKTVSREKFIKSVFNAGEKWKVDVKDILDDEFMGLDPEKMSVPMALDFAAKVKEKILEKKGDK